MDNIYIVDESTGEVVFDSEWPVVKVDNTQEMLDIAHDQLAFDDGKLDGTLFMQYWGIHPADVYTVALDCK